MRSLTLAPGGTTTARSASGKDAAVKVPTLVRSPTTVTQTDRDRRPPPAPTPTPTKGTAPTTPTSPADRREPPKAQPPADNRPPYTAPPLEPEILDDEEPETTPAPASTWPTWMKVAAGVLAGAAAVAIISAAVRPASKGAA